MAFEEVKAHRTAIAEIAGPATRLHPLILYIFILCFWIFLFLCCHYNCLLRVETGVSSNSDTIKNRFLKFLGHSQFCTAAAWISFDFLLGRHNRITSH